MTILNVYFSNYAPSNITKCNFCPLCKLNTVKAIWLKLHTLIEHNERVRVFTVSDLITGSDRIGPDRPKIGLFLCLTDCFFFTRMMCIKDYVIRVICMHLNILILI